MQSIYYWGEKIKLSYICKYMPVMMPLIFKIRLSAVLLALIHLVASQSTTATPTSCSTLSYSIPSPSLAAGYEAQLVIKGLKGPRSIHFDGDGNLLVLDRGVGLVRYSIDDGCLLGSNRKIVIENSEVSRSPLYSVPKKLALNIFAFTSDKPWSGLLGGL